MLMINAFGVVLLVFVLLGINHAQTVEYEDTSYIHLDSTPKPTVGQDIVSNTYEEGSTTETTSKTTPPAKINNNCPAFLFQCKAKPAKSNSLYSQGDDVAQSKYICIDKSRLCDHVQDCPLGEDEASENCQPEHSGCYLCRGSRSECIEMAALCDDKVDCPLKDDESAEICHWSNKNNTNNIISNYPSHNLQAPNIIISQQGLNDKNNLLHLNPNYHSREISINQNNPSTEENGTAGPRESVGFMFRIDNFVIYNSEVKMFNQDSENVGAAKPKEEQIRYKYQNAHNRQQQTTPYNGSV